MLRAAAITAVAATAALSAGPASAVPPPKDISANGQYWFTLWAVSSIWAAGAQGQGVTVAVVDTGVDASAPGMSGVVLAGTDFNGGNGQQDPDKTGHGTRMAGLIASQGGSNGEVVGIAPKAKILPITVPDGATDSNALFGNAIRYAADHGAKIINISQAADTQEPAGCDDTLQAAVKYAVDKGSVVVAAAGNNAQEGNPRRAPAACFGVVAVGAIDAYRHVWPDSEKQDYVDVAAPGVHLYSKTPSGQFVFSDGTSDSAALTSGALALIWSKFPTLTNRQVVAHMLATLVDDVDTPGKDTGAGYGIVRPHIATRNKPSGAEPNPIFDELDKVSTPTSTAPSQQPSTGAPGTGGSTPTTPPTGQASDVGGSSSTVFIVIAGVALIVVLVAVVVIGSRRRRPRPNTYPGTGPGWPQ